MNCQCFHAALSHSFIHSLNTADAADREGAMISTCLPCPDPPDPPKSTSSLWGKGRGGFPDALEKAGLYSSRVPGPWDLLAEHSAELSKQPISQLFTWHSQHPKTYPSGARTTTRDNWGQLCPKCLSIARPVKVLSFVILKTENKTNIP